MENFATFEQSLKLKELGFTYRGVWYYTNHGGLDWEIPTDIIGESAVLYENFNDPEFAEEYNIKCSAPTLEQVAKWLREKKYISIEVFSSLDINSNWVWDYVIVNLNDFLDVDFTSLEEERNFSTYYSALSQAIDEAITKLYNNEYN